MNRNFAMMVLQTVSHARAEACPPPCVNTTNKLQPFGHRRGIKTSTRPIRFAQLEWSTVPRVRSRLREEDFIDFSGKVASWQATGREPACVGPRQRRVFCQSAKGTPAWSPT